MHVTFFFISTCFFCRLFSCSLFSQSSRLSQSPPLSLSTWICLMLMRPTWLELGCLLGFHGAAYIVGQVVEYEVRLYERETAQINLNRLQAELQELQANPPTFPGQILINAHLHIAQAEHTLEEAINTCHDLKRQIIRFMRNLTFLRPIILKSTDSVRALRRARDWLEPRYGPLRYRLSNAHGRVYEDVQLVCRQY